MQNAYEKKIDSLTWERERIKKDKSKSIIDLKYKMDKEIEIQKL